MKRPRLTGLILCLLIFLPACSGASGSSAPQLRQNAVDGSMDTAAGYAPAAAAETINDQGTVSNLQEAPDLAAGMYAASSGDASQPEKIIKTGNVTITTANFDADKARLESLAKETGGFIESSSVYNVGGNRRYDAVLRVPGDQFSDLKKSVEETGKLISSNENEQNVTGQYYDTAGRLATKRVEEERVLDMIGKADNVDTLLSLEDYLGRVRTDIDLLESQIKDMDSLSSYSTLNVSMTEDPNVRLMANTGNFGLRLWQNFISSTGGTAAFLGNALVFLAGAVVPLALIALVTAAGILVYKKFYGRRKERVSQ